MELKQLDYEPVSMLEGKVPAEKWRHLYAAPRTVEDIQRGWRETFGIAVITREPLVVIDVDDGAIAADILERCGLKDAPICRTPSGGLHAHGLLRKGVERSRTIKVKGEDADLLTGIGLSIIPPTPGYEWLGPGLPALDELPKCKVAWTRERTKKAARIILSPAGSAVGEVRDSLSRIANPEAYCLKIPSVQGQNGSKGLVRVVCVMRDAGRTPEQTLAFLRDVWNAQCAVPPWSEGEIVYAINRHFGKR